MTDVAFCQRSAATARRMLERYGAPAALLRSVEGEYDPSTGGTAGVAQAWPCTVAALTYSARDADGSLVQVGDRRLLVAPDVASEPQTGDVFRLVDGEITAVNVSKLAPAGIVVLYEVQARG